MDRIIKSLVRGFFDLFHPSLLLLGLVSFFLSVFLWVGLLFFAGPSLLLMFSAWTEWAFVGFWGWLLLILISSPLILLFSLLILSWLTFPWVRSYLSKRGVSSRKGQGSVSIFRQVLEIFTISCLGVAASILSLVFFWMPLISVGVTVGFLTWAQWRLLTLDFWGESLSMSEVKNLRRSLASEGLLLTFCLAFTTFIPVFNFIFPIYSALCFGRWDSSKQQSQGVNL